jgi:hypothetical protein
MNSFIDLDLLKIGDDSKKIYDIDSAIKESNVTVILGAPGSGKSSLLSLFEEKNVTVAKKMSFQDFDINPEIDSNIQYLLLDGLDEFRNAIRDNKTGILKKVALKIKKAYSNLNVAIACREMDWFGNSDEDALKSFLQTDVQVFAVQPLSDEKKSDLLNKIGTDRIDESYKELVLNHELFDNPQILKMFVDVCQKGEPKDINTKADLFRYYITFSQEHNVENRDNGINQLEPDLFEKIAGYMAYYYMFANINGFNSDVCQKISSNEHGYRLEDINIVAHSKLMQSGSFGHRMIAEYLSAKYLYEEKIKKESWPIERMKALLTGGENIVFSECRGVYAWLCFFSKDQSLIEIDPFLQYQYGDNSLFVDEEKLKIIRAIRKYSESKPYFMKYSNRNKAFTLAWDGDEDDLISLYRESWNEKNHFLHFLNDILLVHSENPPLKLQEFTKEVISRKELESYYKVSLLEILKKDFAGLQEILKGIKDGRIEDERNELKDKILGVLYPECIKPNDIVSYVESYKPYKVFCNRFGYLMNTPDENLDEVLRQLGPKLASFEEVNLRRAYEDVLGRYFIYLLNSVPENIFWEKIEFYNAHLKSNHIYWKAQESLCREEISEEKKVDLYTSYLSMTTPKNEAEEESCYKTQIYIIGLALNLKPRSTYALIEKLLKENSDKYFQQRLINELARDYNIYKADQFEELKEKMLILGKKYGVLESVRAFISSQEKIIAESQKWKDDNPYFKEVQAKIEENEQYIATLSDEDKSRNLGIQCACSYYYLHHFNDSYDEKIIKIREQTYEMFCDILKKQFDKNLNSGRIFHEITSIKCMAEKTPMQTRDIDFIYMAMLVLNDEYDFSSIVDDDVREYFYIISIMINRTANIRHSRYEQYFESNDLNNSIVVLKKFFEYYVQTIDANEDAKNVLLNVVRGDNDGKKTLMKLKQILSFIPPVKTERYKYLIGRFLDEYALLLDVEDLEKIIVDDGELNKKLQSLIVLKKKDDTKVNKELVVLLYHFLANNLDKIPEDQEVFFLKSLLKEYKEESILDEENGDVTLERSLMMDLRYNSFLSGVKGDRGYKVLGLLLEDNELSDFWKKRLKTRKSELSEEINENHIAKMTLEKAKEYIFNRTYINELDFWKDVCCKFLLIKREIEGNRENQKDAFYLGSGKSRDEEGCRDLILIKWNDKYSMIAKATKEKYEANNRVDINLQCLMGISAEVQVECKKDSNRQIMTGIPDQLVDKYLRNKNVNYGIYLVFCFKKTDLEKLKSDLKNTIPPDYSEKIEVMYMDLNL